MLFGSLQRGAAFPLCSVFLAAVLKGTEATASLRGIWPQSRTQVHEAQITLAWQLMELFTAAQNDAKHEGDIPLLAAQVQMMTQRAGSTSVVLDLDTACQ